MFLFQGVLDKKKLYTYLYDIEDDFEIFKILNFYASWVLNELKKDFNVVGAHRNEPN